LPRRERPVRIIVSLASPKQAQLNPAYWFSSASPKQAQLNPAYWFSSALIV
jgi:hypothetical protein